MKIERFNESATNPEPKRIDYMEECKRLFREVWEDKLLLVTVNIQPTNDFEGYQMWCRVNRDIKNDTLKDFVNLFELVDKLNFKYRFGNERLDIYMDNIAAFIDEMNLILNVKKYNL